MTRDLTATLEAAENSGSRHPIARATVRDMRLRFSHFTSPTNPWGLSDTDSQDSQAYVYGDAVVLDSGTILRAWADQSGDLLLQTITAPATASNWSDASNAWIEIATAPNAGDGIHDPGMVAEGNNARIFYETSRAEGGALGLHYRDSSTAWDIVDTGLNIFGVVAYAPVSFTELYAYVSGWQGHANILALLHIYYDGADWVLEEAPFRLGSDKDNFVYFKEYSSITYFDAFVLNGINHILYSFGDAGQAYVVRHQNGVWGEPRLLIPDDATGFVVYRVSVINDLAFATGRITRANDPDFSPAWDCYLMSADGLNWSALSRDSFICQPEVRGKLLLSGDTLYYPGLANVWSAPATYRVGADPSGSKLVLTSRLAHIGLTFPAAGLAPTIELDIANADESLTGSSVVQDGSEVWIETGYKTSAGDEYQLMLQGSIDSVQAARQDGQKQLTVSGRSAAVKALHDWVSPFYWTLPSQLRYFDPCDNTNTLAPVLGTWESESGNLFANPSFEVDASGWSTVAEGGASGTVARTTDQSSLGAYSYQIDKTGGAATDRYGTSLTFSGLAGKTYRAEIDVLVTAIAGGAIEWTVEATGNVGDNGATISVPAIGTGTTLAFQTVIVEIPVVTADTVTLTITFSNALTGTLYLDNFNLIQESIGYLAFRNQDSSRGLLVSTTPFSAGDYDIQGEFTNINTVPAKTLVMGLIGQYVDANNHISFLLDATGDQVLLLLVRGGALSTLASAAFTVTEGVTYNLRLVHRGGQFWGYAKATSGAGWLDPLVNYRWSNNTECNTDDGRGSVGAAASIIPFRLIGAAIDELSTTIIASVLGDIGVFGSSGTVTWETEEITFTGNTGTTLTGCTRGVNGTSAVPHVSGQEVRLFCDEEIRLDNWQYTDTEPNYTTESLIQRVAAMAGVFRTDFQTAYPRPGYFDPTAITTPAAGSDLSYRFLPGVDSRNIDLTFNWSCDQWGEGSTFSAAGVILRADTTDLATAHAYVLFLEDLGVFGGDRSADVYTASLRYYDGAGSETELDTFKLIQRPRGHGPHSMRVLARDDFFCIYCDGSIMGTFRDTTITLDQTTNYAAVLSKAEVAFTDIRWGELAEWRETAWVDNEAVGQSVIETVVIDDRPIYMVVKANDTLYYSLFDSRPRTLGEANDGSFTNLIYSDQSTTQDSDLVSMLRIYAVTILEELDTDLARDIGFVFAGRQMPRAENLSVAEYFPRIFRRSQEVHGARTEEMPANLALEVEDQFTVYATPSGSHPVAFHDLIERLLIVNDITYEFAPADFTMQLGLRTSTDPLPLRDWPWVRSAECILNLDAELGVELAGPGVETWRDQSGHGNDFQQLDDAVKPGYEIDGGRFEVAFYSSGKWLTGPLMADNLDSFAVFMVIKQWSTAPTPVVLGNLNPTTGAGWELRAITPGMSVVSADGVHSLVQGDSAIFDADIYGLYNTELVDRSTLNLYYNQTAVTADGVLTPPVADYRASTPLTLGASSDHTGFSDLRVRQLMIYAPAPNTHDRQLIQQFLKAKWGV